MKIKKPKVFVALSGGVDSSVAALLLKNQGYDVVGVFMRCFNVDGCAERDAEDARRVAGDIGIPFYAWDFEEEYKKRVVEYMVRGYKNGITPNPDVMCNREIKFGVFLKKALAMGANYVATGHYVRLKRESLIPSRRSRAFGASDSFSKRNFGSGLLEQKNVLSRNPAAGELGPRWNVGVAVARTSGGRRWSGRSGLRKEYFSLHAAKDKGKDQSYFLWTLTRNQLRYCLFPIGDYKKTEVRAIARGAGLPTADKKDSQGICFLGKVTLADFLRRYIPEKHGEVFTVAGKKVGEHSGVYFYTIGQRHGLGISAPRPYYITDKNVRDNEIIVAEGKDHDALYKQEVVLQDLNFISETFQKKISRSDISVLARVRYRQPLTEALMSRVDRNAYKLAFRAPQKFVAPGQSAVFYAKNGEMLGGGVII